jgi:signal transduction histidine kinase
MTLRTKLLFVFIALAVAPLLAVSVLNYLSGMRAVEGLLRERAEERARRTAHKVEHTLSEQQTHLVGLANAPSMLAYVQRLGGAAGGAAPAAAAPTPATPAGQPTPPASPREVPYTVRAHINGFYKTFRTAFESLTCLDAAGRPLFRIDSSRSPADAAEVTFQTEDFISVNVYEDKRVWALTKREAVRSPLLPKRYGPALYVSAPTLDGGRAVGALVLEIKLERVFAAADEKESPGTRAEGAGGRESQSVVAINRDGGQIVYNNSDVLPPGPAETEMPYFARVAARMREGAAGFDSYDAPDGHRWVAAYRPVDGLPVSLSVAENYTQAVAGVRRAGLSGVGLAAGAGLTALVLLLFIARRATQNIERVTRGAAAIAGGDLAHHIDVSASGETRQLAESFNLMTERLREQIAREAESRQFQSFMRLSAMLTHDLKNAITGLSMLVSNMERQFHREEFRADAIEALREATEKLKRVVARLSEPVRSLSGEYRRDSRPTDLVPIIRRVLAAAAEPHAPLYEVEAHLPDTLVATVEPERIENVIENLVINALEAMSVAGGRLTVEAGEEEGDRVFISVSDTGAGMTEEFIRTRLFRPFATTKTRGIGLGMFTCREIVEAHGGRLEVESRVGAGTRFRVVLPSRLFTSGDRRKSSTKGMASVSTNDSTA